MVNGHLKQRAKRKKNAIKVCLADIGKKEKQLHAQERQVSSRQIALANKNYEIAMLKKESGEKNELLLCNIACKLDQLRWCYNIEIFDINNQGPVTSFIYKAQGKHKEIEETAQKMRALRKKYDGLKWKDFSDVNKDRLYWGAICLGTMKKIERFAQLFNEFSIFLAVAQNLYMILPIQKSSQWGVKELYTQLSVKEEVYRWEIKSLVDSLKLNKESRNYFTSWRLIPVVNPYLNF